MSTYSDFETGKAYTFSTRAPAVLGAVLNNAVLIGILTYDSAVIFDNIDQRYRAIFPLLPANTPDSPKSTLYYLFTSEAGDKVVFAQEWIEESTITLVEGIDFEVKFTNASLTDIARVRSLLSAMGYTNFKITQV